MGAPLLGLPKSIYYLTVGSWAELCATGMREVNGGEEKLSSLKALSGLNSKRNEKPNSESL